MNATYSRAGAWSRRPALTSRRTVGHIFISYRRDDSEDVAGRISDFLADRFGHERVFQDVEKIAPGVRWDEAIDTAIARSDVVLVVIGPKWSTISANGTRRLDDPDDELRKEVATALARPGTRVMPVLVGGAVLPSLDELPDDIKTLTRFQATTIRTERFRDDMADLADDIEPRSRRVWRKVIPITAAIVFALVGVGVVLATRSDDSPASAPSTVSPTSEQTELSADTPAAPAAPTNTPTQELRGTFNVAVAAFRPEPAGDSDTVREAGNAAEQLVQTLQDSAAAGGGASPLSGLDIAIFDPPAPGANGEVDLTAFAEQHNADVAVFATLQSSEASSSVELQFGVRDDPLAVTERVGGVYGLDSMVFAGNFSSPAVRTELRDSIARRTCVLVHLLSGLSLYREGQYERAAVSFQAAADTTDCSAAGGGSAGTEGQQVANLFLGNIALLQGDLAGADAFYDQALAIEGSFARARFGKAEVAFQKVQSSCAFDAAPTADSIDALRAVLEQQDQAFDDYRQNLETNQFLAPFVLTRAHLQKGRIELCLATLQRVPSDTAAAEFQSVLDAYLQANRDDKAQLVDLAAEAHAGLAIEALSALNFATAVEELTKAIDLDATAGPVARQRGLEFVALRAGVHQLMGQVDLADADCAIVAGATPPIPCPLTDAIDTFTKALPSAIPTTGGTPAPIALIAAALIAVGIVLRRVSRPAAAR
jgi:tetratricopeptide (TPR) repeat protein